jgi:hypothetical protein
MGPITFILVAVLGVMLAMVLKQLFRKEDPAAAPKKPAEDLANLKITDARAGDMVSATGAGDDFGDLEFTIDRRNEYQAGEERWFELGGMYRERRVYLEVIDDDELEVSAVLHPNKLTLEDLGLNEQDVADMDDRQNTADNFEYDGKLWHYRFSKEIAVFRQGQPQPTGYYLWEFRADDGGALGARLLTIRKGESEPFAATIATRVNPGDITVYRAN